MNHVAINAFVKEQNIQAGQRQQKHFKTEGRGAVVVIRLAEKQEKTAEKHHDEASDRPGLNPRDQILHALSAKEDSEQPQVHPHDGSYRNRQAEKMDGLGEREGNFAFAKVETESRLIEP